MTGPPPGGSRNAIDAPHHARNARPLKKLLVGWQTVKQSDTEIQKSQYET